MQILRYILFLPLLMTLTGCVGSTYQSEVAAPGGPVNANAGAGQIVKVVPVANGTNDADMEVLCYYLHLKAMQSLGERGYMISSEELSFHSLPFDAPMVRKAPTMVLKISLDKASSTRGNTVTLGLVSAQQKSATVAVSASLERVSGGVSRGSGKGTSKKGAWGVIAKVNRDSMVNGKGFWQMDESALGIAAAQAFEQAAGKLALD